MKLRILTALSAASLAFSLGCATTAAKPDLSPERISPHLLNPGLHWTDTSRSLARRFSTAWDLYRRGFLQDAERRFSEIRSSDPAYAPAELGLAAVAFARGNFERAEQHMDRAAAQRPGWFLLPLYRAELAHARGDLKSAHQIYRQLMSAHGPSTLVRDRYEQVRKELFDSLFAQAVTSSPETAIPLLREALEVNSEATAARVLLTRKLMEIPRFDLARAELDAMLISGHGENEEVQLLLAELDVGTGRYQDAIVRYERLAQRNPAHRVRLEQIKEQWAQANMPPQQRLAIESSAITRADLAVLIFWNVPAVRFARGLGEPPIAVDIADVVGREELIRALSFRFFQIDPLTRRVDPYRIVTAEHTLRILARIATLRGVPACALEATKEPNEMIRAHQILESCGIKVHELAADPEAPVSGKVAERILVEVASLLRSGDERQARR